MIVPEKGGKQLNTLKFQASRNVFGNESDSDDDTKKKTHLLRPSDNINRQVCFENVSLNSILFY